jgi:biopolymer transport protein TolQ
MTALLVLAQIGGAVPSSARELIMESTTSTKVVLGILAFLSLLSWAVMFGAWREMRKAMRAAESFRREFERTSRLDEASNLAKHAAPTALPRLFLRGVRFVADTQVINQQAREAADERTVTVDAALTGSQIETLHLVIETEASAERDRLGRYLPWLATIGSVSPLIGLLGTVLGVIHSFLGIATRGSGNLSAVAPGVAEALIATAAALAVAIPATFGYNIFANRLNRLDGMMDSFGTAIVAMLVREGHI